jgi:hypothetical protein
VVVRHAEDDGGELLEIHFRTWKGHGEVGVLDRVPCPGVLGEIAEEALAAAEALTAPLRSVATDEHRRCVFLIPNRDSGMNRVTPLNTKTLTAYIFGEEREGGGVLGRYATQLRGHRLEGFSLHHVRHTNATHARAGGASETSIGQYLGHSVRGQAALQAGIFYVAGGNEGMRRRTVEELGRVGGRGYVMDALCRIEVEHMGADDPRRDHPAARLLRDELPVEEALARIRSHNIVEPLPWTVEDGKRLLQTGVVIRPTHFGGCLLPKEDGGCPAGGHACYLGTTPGVERVKQGCGCDYQVLLPSAADALLADAVDRRERMALLEGPSYAAARQKLETEVRIIELQADAARMLERFGKAGENR